MECNPLVAKVRELMAKTGMVGRFLKATYNERVFGNAEAWFEVDGLRLHFYRDRGQDFLELGLTSEPACLYLFAHVQIAMGWTSVEQVVKKVEPDPLEDLLVCVKNNLENLVCALSNHPERFAEARLDVAKRLGWLSPSSSDVD